jgi:hypothetical protein
MEETKRRAICEMHSDTRILYNVLENKLIKDKQEQVTYQQLSAAISRDVQSEARGMLATARKNIEQEHAVIIEPVIGIGLKVTVDYAGVKDKELSGIRRKGNRAHKRLLNAIAGKDLDDTVQLDLAIGLSTLGAIELCTKPTTRKRLGTYIESHGRKELPTAETLRLFAGDNNGKKQN